MHLLSVFVKSSVRNILNAVPLHRYKYTYMEEMLGNIAGCRQVFERWMEWEPEEQAWHSYINFELRYKEVEKARTIYERYILLLLLLTCRELVVSPQLNSNNIIKL